MKPWPKAVPPLGILTVLAAGTVFTLWMAARADRELRTNLLQQTSLVAKAVDLDRVLALTGTLADVTSPDYLRLKEQLASVRSANPRCRFIYLMGRKPDGRLFFYVDNEPSGSENESQAGMVYRDAPEGFHRVFATGVASAEGPFTDQWGTFVSGAVPSFDPATGRVNAVLGMDIDAHDWKLDVAARAALPTGLMLVALLLAYIYLLLRRTDAGLRFQQEELRESETLQRILLDSLPVGVVIVDPVTRMIERVNDHVATLFGAPADHLVGHRCHSLLCPADEGACPVCDLGKTVDNSKRQMLRVDGSKLPIIKTVKRVHLKGKEKLLECFVDVSELQRTEEELRSKTALLEAQANATLDGILVVDAKGGRRIFTNRRISELFQVPSSVLDNEDDRLLLKHVVGLTQAPDEFLAKVNFLYEHPNETSRDEIEFKNGMILDRYSAPVVGRDGEIYGRIWTFRDITERKRAEVALAQTVQELQLFNQFSINRELVMIELKKQVNDCRSRLGESPAFDLQGLIDPPTRSAEQRRSDTP